MNIPGLQLDQKRQAVLKCLNSNQLEQARLLCQQLCQEADKDIDAWLLLAAIQAHLGAFSEVVACCGRAIALQPDNLGALYNLGVAHQAQGQLIAAENCYREVLRLAPDNLSSLINLGIVLRAQGRAAAAAELFEKALLTQPGILEVQNNLGLCYLELGEFPKSLETFQSLVRANPGFIDAHCNLSLCLRDFGRPLEAIAILQQALVQNPHNAQLHYTLGNIFRATGQDEAAATNYRQAIALHPSYYEANNNLGNLLHIAGRLEEAENCFRAALRIQPRFAEIHYNLSTVLYERGMRAEALEHSQDAVQTRPDVLLFRQQFVQQVSGSRVLPSDAAFLNEIIRSYYTPGVNYQYLATATIHLLEQAPDYILMHERYTRIGQRGIDEGMRHRDFLQLARNKLFLALLTQTVACRAEIEQLLTALRRTLLLFVTERWRDLKDEEVELLGALACQCTNNEYAYAFGPDEVSLVDTLAATLDTQLVHGAVDAEKLQPLVAVYAMYRSLKTLSNWERLTSHNPLAWASNVRILIDRQLREWAIEQALRAQIEPLTIIQDAVSNKVREQYEESPYPRWLSVNLLTPKPYSQVLKELFPYFIPPRFAEPTIEVLVAGCGTGKHAILSKTRFADSEHLAIDLSLVSLAYARRKATEYSLEHLRFAQADILELGNCGLRFHIIESIGVLHHLYNPSAGLKVLAGLLHPNGLMCIGLYSTRARHNITMARAAFPVNAAKLSDDQMRQTRSDIIAMAHGNPIRQILQIEDFYSLSECRDLLFHVQEHCFTLPEVAALLDENGLRFIGFEYSDPGVKADYRRAYPGDTTLTNLHNWDVFEQSRPELFLSMYVFWCQKK